MGRSPSHKKTRLRAEKPEKKVVCNRQFPDCPAIPNEKDCITCPFWKRD